MDQLSPGKPIKYDPEKEYYVCYCEECAPKVEALIAKIRHGQDIDEQKIVNLSFIGALAEEKWVIPVTGD